MCEFPIYIPNALHDMVQDFITSALCERPDNYIDYAVEYHKKLKEGVKRGKPTRKRIELKKRKLSPIRSRDLSCDIAARNQQIHDQNNSPPNNEYYRVSPQIPQNKAAAAPSGVYQLTSVSDQIPVPPGTILYRTCGTPPLYQSTNSAVVYLTDPAISQDVSSLVTPNEKLDRIKNPFNRTAPHHKLISSPTLSPASVHSIATETHNGHPQLSQHFSYACSTMPEEGMVCRCCGMIFRELLDYNRHSSLHIVHASTQDNLSNPTSQYSASNTSMQAQAANTIPLFKCLECNSLFKHYSSLRLHYYKHAQGSQ